MSDKLIEMGTQALILWELDPKVWGEVAVKALGAEIVKRGGYPLTESIAGEAIDAVFNAGHYCNRCERPLTEPSYDDPDAPCTDCAQSQADFDHDCRKDGDL